MPSDLTERLAAKRWPRTDCFSGDECSECHPLRVDVAENAASLLPLLLSEPELVAGLAPEAKREVLAMLFDERVREMYDGADVTNACIGLPAMNIAGEKSSKVFPVRRQDLRDILVPPPSAPEEAR